MKINFQFFLRHTQAFGSESQARRDLELARLAAKHAEMTIFNFQFKTTACHSCDLPAKPCYAWQTGSRNPGGMDPWVDSRDDRYRRKLKTYAVFCLVFLSATIRYTLYAIPYANAQALSIGVYPPVTKVDALPPVSLHIPLRVQNTGDDAIDVGISLKPFKPSSREDGSITYLKDSSTFPSGNILLLKKITVSDDDKTVNTVSLLPKEEREVSVDIPLGKNEIPGDYYFSVVFTSRLSNPASAEDNSQASTAQAGVASHILLSVGPKGSSTGKITEFSTPFFQTEGPVPFTLRLTNTSKNAIAPSGNILITNMFGQTIGKVDLLPVDVLSDTTRIIPDRAQITKEGVVNEDLYNKFLSTGPKALWQEKFLLGFYSAQVTLKLSDDGPILRSSTTFLALPIQFFIGLLLGCILVFTIVKRVKEKLKHVPK
jgi:hypothetical protein